jgi:hypothetical protein
MPLSNDVLEAKQTLSSRLLSIGAERGVVGRFPVLNVMAAAEAAGQNVHSVGVGHKIVDGKLTEEPCIRLYVVQKLAESLLSANDVLPSEVDGIATDVIESPPAYFLPNDGQGAAPSAAALAACTNARRKRQRPVMAGISSAHFQVTAGTISCFCHSTLEGDDPDTVYVLSNNHVFADVNKAQIGDDLYQPGPADGGTNGDRFALLHRFVPIQLGGQIPNRVDAAIGELLPGVQVDSQICTIGHITGIGVAEETMRVGKHGRTTGYTEGTVFDPSIDSLVGMDHNDPSIVALFQNQLRINVKSPFSAFGLGGDSGSLVVNQATREAIGLYNAGPAGGEYGLANRIQDVLAEMEIELLN